jgi:hypothetical protein
VHRDLGFGEDGQRAEMVALNPPDLKDIIRTNGPACGFAFARGMVNDRPESTRLRLAVLAIWPGF